MNSRKMLELSKKIQGLAHEYGYEDFRDALTQACFDAEIDTQDFTDSSLSERYNYLGNAICNAAINEPDFDCLHDDELDHGICITCGKDCN